MNLFFFSSFSFISVAWFFSRYYFMSKTADARLLMVAFEGVEALESALIVWTGYEFFSVCSFLAHSRTWESDE